MCVDSYSSSTATYQVQGDRPSLLLSQGHEVRYAKQILRIGVFIFSGDMVFHAPRRRYRTRRDPPPPVVSSQRYFMIWGHKENRTLTYDFPSFLSPRYYFDMHCTTKSSYARKKSTLDPN